MFKKSLAILAVVAGVILSTGCTRITDGEVGIRVTTTGTIEQGELKTGLHQTLFGDVLEMPIRDITFALENATPLTAENTSLSDFDVSVVYSLNPNAVADLYTKKARSFHARDDKGDTLLMYNYIGTLVNNAVQKSVRQYKQLEVADNRAQIEQQVKAIVLESLKAEQLENSILVSAIQVRNIKPNAQILQSATELVKSQNDLKIKDNEVQIAKKEAERMQALAVNSTQSIAYMQAQAQLTIANAVREGKVATIIIPSSLTALGNIATK